MAAVTGGKTYEYPDNYGYGECLTHDDDKEPFCTGDEKEDFCSSTWCYVDPDTCTDKAFAASSYFEREGEKPKLFYSYATCGGDNTFDNSGKDDCKCATTPEVHANANADDANKVDVLV